VEDGPLTRENKAIDLLDTATGAMARSAALAARTGDVGELRRHADVAARYIARPARTRALARDVLAVAAREARRLLGRDERLSPEEFAHALELVGDFERRAASHFPPGTTPA
jgi:uncharacterized membrane protein YccC